MTEIARSSVSVRAALLEQHFDLPQSDRDAILNLPHVQARVSRELELQAPQQTLVDACLVEAGLIGSVGFTKEGKRQIIAVFTPGELCNVSTIVAREASTPLVALASSKVRWIKGQSLSNLTHENTAVTKALWRMSALQSAVLKEWVINLGRRYALERIAHLLCEMACRYAPKERKDGLEFEFPVTQSQIADIVGLTAVRVNHSIKALRSYGLLTFNRGRIKIINWERLTQKEISVPTICLCGKMGSTYSNNLSSIVLILSCTCRYA